MREQFFEAEGIPKERLRALMARRDGPGLARFVAQAGLILVGAGVTIAAGQGWLGAAWAAAGIGAVAVGHVGMFAALHEAGHRTAFGSRWLNELVAWFASFVILYTPTLFRSFHFAHHRHTHDPRLDPEITVAQRPGPEVIGDPFIYIGFLSGLPLAMMKTLWLLSAASPLTSVWSGLLWFVPERDRRRVRREARMYVLAHAALIALGVMVAPGALWLYSVQLFGHMLLAPFILAEHSGLEHDGTILQRTRTTQTVAPVRWLLWNMPFHAEHHALPAVPFHALPALHEALRGELVHESAGYTRFHVGVVERFFKPREA